MVIFTIVWLCVYVPLETSVSAIGEGLFTFGYLIDVVGMALMAAGVAAARRTPADYGMLAAGWAWTSANFWRGTMERYGAVEQGRSLQFGLGELIVGPVLTVLAMAALAGALWRTRRT
jgi:hypothetical protein